jgi:predicted fused transcriptional regulator/phosphomethylpyrimidine kinase/predicted transcriptional regulator
MRFIEEVVVDEFLPTFRSLLAEELREQGLTQSEVAELLGISQSAVSKYVHGEVGRNERIAAEERVTDLVARLADGLADGSMTTTEALVEAEVCIRALEQGGVLADIHATDVPELSDYGADFSVHDSNSRLREAGRVRASVRQGLRILENTGGFAALIPAVGSNLVESLPDAERIEDVAAVPGRILDVGGQATVPGDPEFGVSQHVANVLLVTRGAGSDARAALNIAYDEETVATLDASGLTVAEFDAESSLEDGIGATLEMTPDADVLYQTGAMGIEPICYILGPDAVTVAERLRSIT